MYLEFSLEPVYISLAQPQGANFRAPKRSTNKLCEHRNTKNQLIGSRIVALEIGPNDYLPLMFLEF